MTRRLLVVEDDDDLVRPLMLNLLHAGYEVDRTAGGEEGLAAARTGGYDLVLLDLMLPGRDGFDVLKALRKERVAVPVVCLTARGQEADVVAGLTLGADDYVVKPFSVAELLARIDAVLRRATTGERESSVEIAGVRFDLDARRAVRPDGSAADLTSIETDLLAYLFERRGRPVAREQILKDLWGLGRFATTRTLDNHIARIRKKVEPDPERPSVILTVHGVGYRVP